MIAQGKMGEVDWIITDDGELIIGKEGETQTFEYASSRIDSSWGWNSFREQILSVNFKGQVNGNGSHSSMFEDCKSLTSLDLSNFDTSNITNMADMFYDCEKLISLDLSNFDTSNVTNMTGMFYNCQSLTSLDLNSFSTSSVTNMKFMFANCEKLILLDLNNFNTSNVTNMTSMFYNCQSLISLDLSSFNTSSVTNMDSVFHYCKKLETIYVSSLWNINQVYSSIKMFSNCLKIVGLYETTYDSSKIDKTYARIDSPNQKGYLSSYIEKGVYDNVDWLIDSRYKLFIGKVGEEQTFINRKSRNAYDWPWYESYSINITSISFSGLVNGNGSHADMFYNCQLLTSLNLSNFYTSNITSMKGMFSECCSLTLLDFSGFDTSNVTDMSYMFYHCYVLTPLNLSKFDTPNVTSMNSMFYYCSLLTSLDLSNFNTEKVTDMNFMFSHCERLTTLDISHFNTSSVTAMRYMFSDCNRLPSLNLSNFNTSSVTDMKYMFNNCESLASLNLSSFNISNVTNMYRMFYNCPASINIFYVSNCSKQQGGAEDIDVTDIFTNSGEIFLMRPANVTNPTGVKEFWREVAATNSKVHFEYDDASAPTASLQTQRGKFETKEEEGVTTTVFVEDDAGGNVIKITPIIEIKQDNTPDSTKVGKNTLTSVVVILNNGDYTNFTKLKLNGDGFDSDAAFIQYILNEGSFCIKLNDAPESQYLLELDICDRREDSTFPFKIIIPGVFAMIEFRKGGHGMSIGKICERDGLEVSIPTTIGEGLTLPTTLSGDVDLTKDQLVIGRYNILDANKAFIIGNGEVDSEGVISSSNALTIDWQGRIACGNYSGILQSIFNIFYPVGSYYETSLPNTIPSGESTPTDTDLANLGTTWFNPEYAWGGEWILELEGQVHVSAGSNFNVAGAVSNTSDGGSTHLQQHTHGFTQPTVPKHDHGMTHTHSHSHQTSGWIQKKAADGSSHGIPCAITNASKTGTYTSDTDATASSKSTTDEKPAVATTGGAVGNINNVTKGLAANSNLGNMPPFINVYRWHRVA